jgi:5-methylcytosine-specific restriction endonuclease McrA
MASEEIPQSRPIVTRAEAKAQGLNRYFTGKPCKHGHVAERVAVNAYCVPCRDAALREFCEVNNDRRNEDRRKRHAANPQIKREQKRKHRLANIEKYRRRQKEVSVRFRDEYLQRVLQWQRDNPDKVRAREARRRARKIAAEGFHTDADIREIYDEQGGVCAYCFVPLPVDYHVEHFIPLSKGGSNWPENLRIACPICNAKKGARDPLEFLASECVDVATVSISAGNGGPLVHECPG